MAIERTTHFIPNTVIWVIAMTSVVLYLILISLILKKREQASYRVTWFLVYAIVASIVWTISITLQLTIYEDDVFHFELAMLAFIAN